MGSITGTLFLFLPAAAISSVEQGLFGRMQLDYNSWQANAKYAGLPAVSTLVACSAACLANTNTGCQSYSLYSGQCELGHDPWGGVQVTDSNPTPKAMVGSADIYSAVCTTVQPFSCYSPTVVDWSVLGDWGRLELQGAFFNDPTVCDGGNAPNLNYWLGPGQTEGAFLAIDLGCCLSVSKVVLRNSYNIWHHGGSNERATKNFRLQLSAKHLYARGAMHWIVVVQDVLESVLSESLGGNCTRTQEFIFPSQIARFAKFTGDSYYGYAAGLRYIRFE